MRTRTLFIGSLSLSLAVHALILFTPSRSVSESPSHSDTYRVELIRKPFETAGSEEPENTPFSTVIQEKPKPREDSAASRTTLKQRDHEQIIREGEERRTAASQLQTEPDPVIDNKEEVRLRNSAHRRNGRSSGVPQSSSQNEHTDYQRILGELSQLLKERLRYPELARRKGIEGAVAITLTLSANGNVSNIFVSESSGSRILDRAAVRAISDIFPYPDPPNAPLHFTIPVAYRLTKTE